MSFNRNVSDILKGIENATSDGCSNVYSRKFLVFRQANFKDRNDFLCRGYLNSIGKDFNFYSVIATIHPLPASFTKNCDEDVQRVRQKLCIEGKTEKLQNSGSLRQAYMFITTQRGNIQTINRDLYNKEKHILCW